nr:hypothetical protein [Tanacetum cinerariifolium]
MGDEHLSTIPETESDEVIKSSVEDLVPIPSESEDTSTVYSPKIDSLLEEFVGELTHIDLIPSGIDETDSDPKDDICFIKQLLYDDTLSEDDSFEDIDYVEASPPDSELVGLKESPSSFFLSYSDNSLPEFETFSDHMEETSSGSTTTHADNSLLEYDSFLFEIETDQDFSSSDDSFGSGLKVSFPSGTRNKIFDPGIFIEVQSERLLSREEFSISFIRDPLYPVFDTLLPFLSENEDRVFKPSILTYLLVSQRDKTTSDFSKNPMIMYGGDIPLLDVPYLHFYPP